MKQVKRAREKHLRQNKLKINGLTLRQSLEESDDELENIIIIIYNYLSNKFNKLTNN